MLKLLKRIGRSGALFVTTLVVVAMTMGVTNVACAAPARYHTRQTWLTAHRAHRVLVRRSHLRRHAAHVAIVGGNRISIEQAPWQVAVLGVIRVEEHGEVFFVLLICGGSILDSTHVVTAAHCVYNPATGVPLPAEHVAVVAGVSDLAVEHEPHEQFREAANFRIHPYYSYAAGPGAPDDVAVVTLSGELALSSAPGSAVSAIGLVPASAATAEGSQLNLTGFGRENPSVRLSGELNSIGMTLGFSERCGGEADAVWLCTSASTGSACSGDSGSGLTTTAATPALVGVMDTVSEVSHESCRASSTNGFVNLAAPEIRDFIEGNSSLPLAPRGGNAIEVSGVPKVGNTLTCQPGSWSGEPTIAYLFIDSSSGHVLQSGASSTYALSAGDVGRTILCEVQATNAGGTGTVRTTSLRAIEAAQGPPPFPPPSHSPTSPPPTASQPSSSSSGTGSAPAGSGGVEAATVHHEGVLLAGTSLVVQSGGVALAKLDCREAETCNGMVTLLAKRAVKARGGKKASHTTTVKIGTATFSLEAGATETVKIHLSAAGRALLSAGHGHLAASLTIEETEVHTWTDGVRLVAQQKGHGSRKRRR
jgi:hypothetical protein